MWVLRGWDKPLPLTGSWNSYMAVTIGHSRYCFGSPAARPFGGTPQQTPGCSGGSQRLWD